MPSATALASGRAAGALLWTAEGLSFWGGIDPANGCVIDRHHPLCGTPLAGRVLALPSGRGSCTGSGVLLELLLNGLAPAALLVRDAEEILTLGALVGERLFDRSLPVIRLDAELFDRLRAYRHAEITAERLVLTDRDDCDGPTTWSVPLTDVTSQRMALSADDEAMLAGRDGWAVATAMQLLLRMAAIQGADRLIDVTQVHIDGCIYTGAAGLRFADTMARSGARVRVPTTLNAISVDRRRWRTLGVDPALGEPAGALADAYVAMGARPSFTCAPYLLGTAPGFGEQIGWAESNAVVYANSVLGARTLKYPDFLDLCIALTGRAPLTGCHTDAGRRATLAIDIAKPSGADDSVWPLLGYRCGLACGGEIPLVRGLAAAHPGCDDLKAFAAAFGTSSSAPMFHIEGVTPEADAQAPSRRVALGNADLRQAWEALNTAERPEIDLVSLGNPHFSASEFDRLASLVAGRRCAAGVAVVVTCGRAVHDAAAAAGSLAALEAFGATVITDTCWCMLGEPIVPPAARAVMTNSGKYAHYAPGLIGRPVRFGSLAACVEAACTGRSPRRLPDWLGG